MTRYTNDLILFLLLGILIGLMLRQRETDSNQPPPKRARAQRPPMATRKQPLEADFREATG